MLLVIKSVTLLSKLKEILLLGGLRRTKLVFLVRGLYKISQSFRFNNGC